jgi:hypothetical protein
VSGLVTRCTGGEPARRNARVVEHRRELPERALFVGRRERRLTARATDLVVPKVAGAWPVARAERLVGGGALAPAD